MTTEIENLIKMADSKFRKELYAEALLLYSEILNHQPKNTHALFQRARAKNEIGNVTGALHDLSGVLEFDPKHVMARIYRADWALGLWATDEAINDRQFSEYCKQFYTDGKPSFSSLPHDVRMVAYEKHDIYFNKAQKAETENRLNEAIMYWQAYHDIGGTFDYDSELVLERIERLKKQLQKK